MKRNKKQLAVKMLAMLLAIVMVFVGFPTKAFADNSGVLTLEELRTEKGAITVEAYNIGQGFLLEPSLYDKEGKSVGDITVDYLTNNGLNFQGSTSYFSGFEFDDTTEAEYPSYLEPYSGELYTSGDGNGYLSEFDYSQSAGWVFTVNDWWASYGASDSYPGQEITDYNTGETVVLGDVIRWHYSVFGYGADCGFPGNVMAEWMGGNLFTQEDKTELIYKLAAINDYYGNLDTDSVYETALAVAADPLASAEDIAEQEIILGNYIEETFLSEEETPSREAQDVSAVLNATMAQLAATVTEPTFGTNGGEWTILGLARGEYYEKGSAYFNGYYDRIVEVVNETAASVNLNGALQANKSTDNSRVILALSAIGKDATSVGDWNLVAPFNDFDWIQKQGINGVIYALLALDTNNYVTEDSIIRQQCVDYILEKQFADGGWALSGTTADPDVTAMALQALAPYKNQADVAAAAEEGFACLSTIQKDEGGYASWGTVNAESCAQVIVACTAWGINPDTDSRFVKNNKSVVDALLEYYLEDEAKFVHVIGASANQMATEQACYALVAYNRFYNGQTSLYDMSDVNWGNSEETVAGKPVAALGLPSEITDDPGKTFNATISIDQWDNEAGYKLIDFILNVPEGLEVTAVTANRLAGGTVNYNLETESGKLRVAYFDANNYADLTVSGNGFPAQVFTITLKVQDVEAGSTLGLNIAGMSIKKSSDSSDEEAMVVVDTTTASGNIEVVKGISYSAICLYTGDDVDLIPSNRKAVAVSVVGKDNVEKLTYNDGTNEYEFKYSSEISEKTGVSTYVALVDALIEMEEFVDKRNYSFVEEAANEITFGDSNNDGVINAQDALAAVDTWLRKTDAPSDDEILVLNVNGDSRINTFDALGVMEAFVDGNEYIVISKASELTTNN